MVDGMDTLLHSDGGQIQWLQYACYSHAVALIGWILNYVETLGYITALYHIFSGACIWVISAILPICI